MQHEPWSITRSSRYLEIVHRLKGLGWLSVLAVPLGCGGATSSYEADYDCVETLRCFEETEGYVFAETTVAECTDASQTLYQELDPATKGWLDGLFAACSELMSCDYLDCVNAETGSSREAARASIEPYDTRQPCDEGLLSMAGQLETPLGPLPYDTIETLFWRSYDADCINQVVVTFRQGACGLTLGASGSVDEGGRFLITSASLSNPELCPDYPAGVGDTYTETMLSPESEPLGTIAIIRPDVSWDECVAGELVVTLDVVLRPRAGFTSPGAQDVDLTGLTVQIPGSYSMTHSGSPGCPAVDP
jgi:hypothetical protein